MFMMGFLRILVQRAGGGSAVFCGDWGLRWLWGATESSLWVTDWVGIVGGGGWSGCGMTWRIRVVEWFA